jgi:hypothetical protein
LLAPGLGLVQRLGYDWLKISANQENKSNDFFKTLFIAVFSIPRNAETTLIMKPGQYFSEEENSLFL